MLDYLYSDRLKYAAALHITVLRNVEWYVRLQSILLLHLEPYRDLTMLNARLRLNLSISNNRLCLQALLRLKFPAPVGVPGISVVHIDEFTHPVTIRRRYENSSDRVVIRRRSEGINISQPCLRRRSELLNQADFKVIIPLGMTVNYAVLKSIVDPIKYFGSVWLLQQEGQIIIPGEQLIID